MGGGQGAVKGRLQQTLNRNQWFYVMTVLLLVLRIRCFGLETFVSVIYLPQ